MDFPTYQIDQSIYILKTAECYFSFLLIVNRIFCKQKWETSIRWRVVGHLVWSAYAPQKTR